MLEIGVRESARVREYVRNVFKRPVNGMCYVIKGHGRMPKKRSLEDYIEHAQEGGCPIEEVHNIQ